MAEMGTPNGRSRPTDEELLTAVPQGTRGHEARLGLFVIFGLVSFVIVLYWLTDPALFRGRYMLVTTVEHAGGIRRADPVQMNGVNVGRTNDFQMMQSGQVHIVLEIERGWQIPRGSTTRMGSAGMFGGRTVEIIPGQSSEFYQAWDTIPGAGPPPSDILATASDLGSRAGNVLQSIDRLLDAPTIGSVQGSAQQLEGLLSDLSRVTMEQRDALRNLTASLQRSAEGLEEASAAGPDVARAVARADSAIAVLNETGTNLDLAITSLRGLLARVEQGEGTLGRLSQDDALYVNLNTAALSLTQLVEDIQANPRRYISVSIF